MLQRKMLLRYRWLPQRLVRRRQFCPTWDGFSVKMLCIVVFLVAIRAVDHRDVGVNCFHLDVQKVNHIVLDNEKVRKLCI